MTEKAKKTTRKALKRNVGEIIQRGRIWYIRYYDGGHVVVLNRRTAPTVTRPRSCSASGSARRTLVFCLKPRSAR